MSDRCIEIDGSLVRVSDKFDTTEGSKDMTAMRAIIAAGKARLAEMPMPDPHPFEPEPERARLCAVCHRSRLAQWHRPLVPVVPEEGA